MSWNSVISGVLEIEIAMLPVALIFPVCVCVNSGSAVNLPMIVILFNIFRPPMIFSCSSLSRRELFISSLDCLIAHKKGACKGRKGKVYRADTDTSVSAL